MLSGAYVPRSYVPRYLYMFHGPMFAGPCIPRIPIFHNAPRYGVKGTMSCNTMQPCNFAYIRFLVTCAELQINVYMNHIDGCSGGCSAVEYHTPRSAFSFPLRKSIQARQHSVFTFAYLDGICLAHDCVPSVFLIPS